ncbi:hypothetical protein MBLNU230_g8548t1 [Neophaeotheca triangularis]
MITIRSFPVFVLLTIACLLLFITLAGRDWTPSLPSSGSATTLKPSADVAQRREHAEKLWLQSVSDRSVILEKFKPKASIADPLYPYNLWDFFRPTFFCPQDLERVGKLADGGKWVCGMSGYERVSPGPASGTNPVPDVIIYSFGVNDDSSFEAAMLSRTNAEIWGYDFSVETWAHEITPGEPRAHFTKYGIGKVSKPETVPPTVSIPDLMKQNGHDYIDIMKIDIEGAEFDALTSLMDYAEQTGSTLPVGQLFMELHIIGDSPGNFKTIPDIDGFLKWWGRLEKLGMRPVFNEHNWVGDEGFSRPQFVEYTMINNKDPRNKIFS